MKWFWKNKTETSQGEEVIKQLTAQNDQLQAQCMRLEEQVTKLSRIQYKASKDIQKKMDDLYEALFNKQQQEQQDLHKQLVTSQARLEGMIQFLIQRLDELDLIHAKSVMGEQEHAWLEMNEQWIQQILTQLQHIGVVEVQMLGKSFDPTIAEALGTISLQQAPKSYPHVQVQAHIPYQVVEVLKRGFILQEGVLVRKAQVITIEGGKLDVE